MIKGFGCSFSKDSRQQFVYMSASAVSITTFAHWKSVIPTLNVITGNGNHGLISKNRNKVQAQVLAVLVLSRICYGIAVALVMILYIRCGVFRERDGISALAGFSDSRRCPSFVVNKLLFLVKPCFGIRLSFQRKRFVLPSWQVRPFLKSPQWCWIGAFDVMVRSVPTFTVLLDHSAKTASSALCDSCSGRGHEWRPF